MKPYLSIAIAAGLVVVGLAAALFLTPALAAPESQLEDQIADEIAQAQAMLATYSPVDAALLRRFDASTTTQPSTAEQPASDLPADVRQALTARQNLISEALGVIQNAVQAQVGEASGGSSVAATRLQTLLFVEQAQIHRREGDLHWRLAAQARQKAADLLAHWTDIDAQVRSLETTLSGRGVLPTQTAPAAAAAAPAQMPSGPTERSRLGTMIGKLLGGSTPPAPAQPAMAAATEPAPAAPTGPATQPAIVEARPPASPDCTLDSSIQEILSRQTQSPAQRITDLRLCRTEVEQRLSQAQQQVAALTPQVEQTRARINAAKAQADAAQKQMLTLERAGVDATDPQSLPRFTKEYTDASTAYRKATRTISILTGGSSETPRLSPDEKEMLLEPAIEVDPELQQEHRGLTALESDLSAARALVETQQKLLGQIDSSIDRLNQSQEKLSGFLAAQKASRDRVTESLAAAAREAVAHAVQAYAAEQHGLTVLEQDAVPAAQRAQQAAQGVREGYVGAAAEALDGDINAARAAIQAQRADGLSQHAGLLAQLEPAALPPENLTPQAAGQEPAGPWATQAGAATTAATEARTAAAAAATEAMGAYTSAANSAGNLWTLHTEIAAMHYLIGNLGGPDAEEHFKKARQEYELATRDRRDRPEVQPLRAVYEKLAQAR